VGLTHAERAFNSSWVCGFSTRLSTDDAGDIGFDMVSTGARARIDQHGLRGRDCRLVQRSTVDRKFVAKNASFDSKSVFVNQMSRKG
jgi:hypothetical protein